MIIFYYMIRMEDDLGLGIPWVGVGTRFFPETFNEIDEAETLGLAEDQLWMPLEGGRK